MVDHLWKVWLKSCVQKFGSKQQVKHKSCWFGSSCWCSKQFVFFSKPTTHQHFILRGPRRSHRRDNILIQNRPENAETDGHTNCCSMASPSAGEVGQALFIWSLSLRLGCHMKRSSAACISPMVFVLATICLEGLHSWFNDGIMTMMHHGNSESWQCPFRVNANQQHFGTSIFPERLRSVPLLILGKVDHDAMLLASFSSTFSLRFSRRTWRTLRSTIPLQLAMRRWFGCDFLVLGTLLRYIWAGHFSIAFLTLNDQFVLLHGHVDICGERFCHAKPGHAALTGQPFLSDGNLAFRWNCVEKTSWKWTINNQYWHLRTASYFVNEPKNLTQAEGQTKSQDQILSLQNVLTTSDLPVHHC